MDTFHGHLSGDFKAHVVAAGRSYAHAIIAAFLVPGLWEG